MRWVVKVVASGDRGEEQERTIATIERGCELKLEELGLTLKEGKEVLASLQRLVVANQVQEHDAELPRCDRCERTGCGPGGTIEFSSAQRLSTSLFA